MASERFCDNYEPHDSHEWHEDYGPMTRGGAVWGSSTYRCWGVKDDPSLAALRDRREIVREHAARIEAEYREAAEAFKRTEAEFYLGDGTTQEEYDSL